MKVAIRRTIEDGTLIGLLGYLTVAVFFAAVNLLAGRSPFYTAELLGRAVTESGAEAATGAGPVLAFNSIHLVFFLALGLGVAWIVRLGERRPDLWYPFFLGSVMGLMALGLFFFLVVVPATAAIPWWSVAMANLAAAAAIGGYLLLAHRELWRMVGEQPTSTL